MSTHDQLTSWLNNAYSMEVALIKVLEAHAKEATELPWARAKDKQHLAETRRHAEQVRACLRLLGEKPTLVKPAPGPIAGAYLEVSSSMFDDEILKNFLSDYAAEHFEIACYRSLIAAADELGHAEIVRICNGILQEEEAMAGWIEEKIAAITRDHLQKQLVG